MPGAHTGQVIVGIFLVGIQLKIISSEAKFIHKKYLFIGVIISFLAGLSDLLFFIQFSSAVLFSYLIFYFKGYLKFKDISYYAFLPFVASLAGILLTKHVVPVDVFSSYLSIFSIKTVTFSRMYAQYIQITHVFKNELNLFSSILFIIFYTGTFLIAFSYLFFFRKTSTLDKTLIFLSYFILFSFCFSVLSICLVGPTVFVLSRYMLPAFYLPFLTIFYLFAIFRNFKFINTSLVWLCIFLVPLYILLSMRVLLNKPGFSIKLSYYPADILCIDQALHDYGHTGISQYWDANLISMLSKENLQVVPVFSDLKKFHFSMNSKKFKNSYSFAVVDIGYISGWKLDEMLIENINGKPERTVICGGRKLLIYPKNNLKLS
ncbi:MAG: hypothetical protein O7C59_10930 [Rickettsia endosymbiont of Ixodes persulcatus]|nr:hypothetical protein [Rickettsia endosymbiont of Ixodes persulcatus]